MLENVRPLEPRFVPRETAPASVRYLLSRKPEKHGRYQLSPRVLSHGAQPDATFGGTQDVVTILCADEKGEEHVGG